MTINYSTSEVAGNAPWVKTQIAETITPVSDLIIMNPAGGAPNATSAFFAVGPGLFTPSLAVAPPTAGLVYQVTAVGVGGTGNFAVNLGRTGIGTEDVNEFAIVKDNSQVSLLSTNSMDRMRALNMSNIVMVFQLRVAIGALVPMPVGPVVPVVIDFNDLIAAFNASYFLPNPVGQIVGPSVQKICGGTPP